MRRIIRTATALPPSADDYRPAASPPVTITHPVGKILTVSTFSGVIVKCKVVAARKVTGGFVYDVTPVGDPMMKDFQRAGVPVSDKNAYEKFVAFDWQVTEK